MGDDTATGSLGVPDEKDWEHHPDDPDWVYAKGLFFGKSLQEAAPLFGTGSAIERVDELRWMPRVPFRYYIRACAAFLLSQGVEAESLREERADLAGGFLDLLLEKQQERGGFVTAELVLQLLPAMRMVAARQEEFEAPRELYGDFAAKVAQIERRAGI